MITIVGKVEKVFSAMIHDELIRFLFAKKPQGVQYEKFEPDYFTLRN